MATIAETLYEDLNVVTPFNLNAFHEWAAWAWPEKIDEVVAVLTVREHSLAGIPPPGYQWEPSSAIQVCRVDLNRSWWLRVVRCEEPGCRACESGLGGYSFYWVGPWTCISAMGLPGADAPGPVEARRNWSNCKSKHCN